MNTRILFLSAITALFSVAALAQSYSIDWHTIDGGGGVSTGGIYQVNGTIGQHDAGGTMSGGNYSVTGGFWSLFVLQTPGAPLLRIFLTATNTAVVSWPSSSAGWNLQQSTNSPTAQWTPPSETISDNGTNRFIVVSPPAGQKFFRLFKP